MNAMRSSGATVYTKQFRDSIILDLGCGNRRHEGAIGADIVALPSVDVICDLAHQPYPFIDGCAQEVILSHVLEHFTVGQIGEILQEVHRVLVPEGVLTISVPHALSVAFYSDPTHRTRFTFETLYYFTEEHPFSYYHDLHHTWYVKRIWASVNLFNQKFQPVTSTQRRFENMATRALNYVVRNSTTWTVPDLLVKQLPFWLVNIHCQLGKLPSKLPADASRRS